MKAQNIQRMTIEVVVTFVTTSLVTSHTEKSVVVAVLMRLGCGELYWCRYCNQDFAPPASITMLHSQGIGSSWVVGRCKTWHAAVPHLGHQPSGYMPGWLSAMHGSGDTGINSRGGLGAASGHVDSGRGGRGLCNFCDSILDGLGVLLASSLSEYSGSHCRPLILHQLLMLCLLAAVAQLLCIG